MVTSTESPHGDHGSHHGGDHGGHGDHAEMFRRKFWVSLALTLPAVLYSRMVQDWLDYTAPNVPGHDRVAAVFGTAVFLYGGPVFLRGGWSELKARQPGMMLLISMGLLVAFGASVATEFGWLDVDLWFELATLVTIMLLGHWQEMKAIGQAQGALAALAELLPDDADRVTDTGVETVPLSALRPGDVVLVRPGGAGSRPTARSSTERPSSTSRWSPASPGRWPRASATGWWPARWPPTRPSGCGSPRSATTPPSPASSDWWPKPRRRALGPRRWPTGSPRCCSTSPPPQGC